LEWIKTARLGAAPYWHYTNCVRRGCSREKSHACHPGAKKNAWLFASKWNTMQFDCLSGEKHES